MKKPDTSRVITVLAPDFEASGIRRFQSPFTAGDGMLARHHRNVLNHRKRRALSSKFNSSRRADEKTGRAH